tara:strand:+ start:535 stop:1785 length:1251 start_codon:yes stop_codon:yes gene_type:complete
VLNKIFVLLLPFLCFQQTKAQDTTSTNSLSVYLDCRGCNSSFIRSEINFINFVRDQSDADVHLIITRQGTASGGTQYTLDFRGQNQLVTKSDNLIYTSYDSDTNDEERNGLVRYVKLGFISFLSEIDALSQFDLTYSGGNGSVAKFQDNDKWKSWIFEIGGNSWFSGEESQNDLSLNGRIRVRRTTEKIKLRLNFDQNYNREVFRNIDSLGVETEDIFTRDRQSVFGLVAWSLGNHWSVGSYFSGGSDTRDNIDLRYGVTPAIEYSFYPYSDFARREVTLRYGLLTSMYNYSEATIYGKNSELLTRQEISFNMNYTKPWGGIEARINGHHYLHDFSKNRLNIDFEIDMRIVRGFSISFETGYAIINDQLSLSAGGITDKEAIANTRQQATSYEFWGSVGFEITFGSIYDNVVNTRF